VLVRRSWDTHKGQQYWISTIRAAGRSGAPSCKPMRTQPATAAGKCPAGYAALSAPGSGGTFYRKLGTPVTITAAGISSVYKKLVPAHDS
jgi:hypothetical protein